jgi:hypothetical protein
MKISDSLPSVRKTCHPVRTPDRPASFFRTTYLSVRTLHCIEKLLFQLASVRTSQQPVWTSISDRSASDSFQVQDMGRLIHRPDDVVSRPDALINKARIVIHISPSGRQSALVPTGVQLIWKLPIRLQPSGRQCLTVQMRILNRKDFQQNFQKILSHICPSRRLRFTIRTASVHITVVAHSAPQPISRGPWTLRTARIRY